ncbi:MAG TPA: NAD-dependent epimerase/dehydratase family protein [Candidatus Limnocylindrales bacterium]
MRIFVAGASGVIGVRLLARLVEAGHVVAGMTRTASKVALLRGLGAKPVVADVFDAEALRGAILDFAPDVIIHELTDLPDDARLIPEHAAANARIRREGTQNLLAAARVAAVGRVLAQSVAWELSGDGGAATRDLERFVLDAGGVILRYGRLYGPGTYHERDLPERPRVHVEEAAQRTVEALDAPTGIVTVVEA